MKTTKKFLSLVLVLIMLLSVVLMTDLGVKSSAVCYEHSFVNYVDTDALKNPATCTKKAVFYKTCENCGKSAKELDVDLTFEFGSTASHTYIENMRDEYILLNATCVDRSIYTKSCAYCGTPKIPQGTDIFNPNTVINTADIFYGQVLRHDFKTTKVFKDSTCVTEGNYEEFTCMRVIGEQVCGFKVGGETIPKKEHTFKEVQPYIAPTCKKNGQYGLMRCETCGAILYFDANGTSLTLEYVAANPLNALGHIDNDKDYICDRCSALVEVNEPEPEEPEYKIENGYYYTVKNGTATVLGIDLKTKGKIVIPSTLGGYSVTAIDDYAFSECYWVTDVVIPGTVKTIGEGAFCYCIALKEIVIPESVTSIGDYAFICCVSLEKLIIKNRNATIGNYIGFSDMIVKAGHTAEEWVNKYYAIIDAELNGGASDSMYEDITRITNIYDDLVANPYLTIYGYEPSTAKTFATTNKVNFINISEYYKKDVDKSTGVEVAYPADAFNKEVELVVKENGANANIVLSTLFLNYKSYDISFIASGSEVQPNGKVTVKLPVPNGYSSSFVAVYYISALGVKTRLDSKVENGYVIFETDHFSEYVIVDESSAIEEPDTPDTPNELCTCKCHGNFIQRLIFKITNFFQKLFGKNKVCACGVQH